MKEVKIRYKWWDSDNNVMVVCIDLPKQVDEFVTANEDGSYTVFIRSTMTSERQHAAYEHALFHIMNGDLEDGKDVQVVERIAHARIQTTA